jgi:hypothetical protein
MAGSQQYFFAAVDNTSVVSIPTDGGYTTRFSANAPKLGGPSVGLSTILIYNGTGWHPIWQSGSDAYPITCLLVSDAYDDLRLWWSAAEKIYYMSFPTGVTNPRADTSIRYASSGEFITPNFDGKMPTEPKTALTLSVRTKGVTVADGVTLYVCYDGEPRGASLPITFPVTSDPYHSEYIFGEGLGVKFYKVRLEGTLNRGALPTDAIWAQFKLRYRRALPILWCYELQLDCSREYGGHTPKEQVDYLKTLADPSDGLLVPFDYSFKGSTSYVSLQLTGQILSGNRDGGVISIRLEEQG